MTGSLGRSLIAVALVALLVPVVSITAQRQQTPSLILESVTGRDSFEFYCASCDGMTGRGDGPMVSALTARPTDLATLALKNNGAFPADRVISRGREELQRFPRTHSPMPAISGGSRLSSSGRRGQRRPIALMTT